MAKLVVLSGDGVKGQSYELKVDKTTIGRLDDNTFPIPQSSVSSHHCEILLQGSDVIVRDLNSTNGTFINNQQVTGEAVLKAGQILRLGQVEIQLESGSATPGTAQTTESKPSSPSSSPSPSRHTDATTMQLSRKGGVKLEQLQEAPPQGLDTTKGVFTKKSNKTNLWFIIGGVILLVVIVGAILTALSQLNSSNH